jgi:hypothetical protein
MPCRCRARAGARRWRRSTTRPLRRRTAALRHQAPPRRPARPRSARPRQHSAARAQRPRRRGPRLRHGQAQAVAWQRSQDICTRKRRGCCSRACAPNVTLAGRGTVSKSPSEVTLCWRLKPRHSSCEGAVRVPGPSPSACGGGRSVPGGAAGGRAAPCTLAVPSPPASGAAPAAARHRHFMRLSCSHGQDSTGHL